ncbi:hypothetical protein [Veillonella sp.]|nr:hypothetical protein [Veillonella sp.]MDU2102808.1 hypothetical protein [Veillonella sp.]
MTKQITQEQYMELMAMLNPVPVSPLPETHESSNVVVAPTETKVIEP